MPSAPEGSAVRFGIILVVPALVFSLAATPVLQKAETAVEPSVEQIEEAAPEQVPMGEAAPEQVPTGDIAPGQVLTEEAEAQESPASPSLAAGDPVAGQVLYAQNCARCHGDRGQGETGDRLIGLRLSLEEVLQLVREPRAMMASFSPSRLSDEQVADIYAYLQTLRSD